MHTYSLSPRLLWIADHTRKDVLFCDVVTDHGKLPIYLCKTGKTQSAIASDIGDAPAARARMNIHAHHLADKIRVCVADGLCGVSITPPCDVAVCGMGGETIVGILEGAPEVKDARIQLLLQPMTDFALVRKYLFANGFHITDEDIVLSEGRMYQCLAASYDGVVRTVDGVYAELGEIAMQKQSPAFRSYVEHRLRIAEKCKLGKAKVGADASEEEALIAAYHQILEDSR